jgi:hypothetical protein
MGVGRDDDRHRAGRSGVAQVSTDRSSQLELVVIEGTT